MNSSEAGSPAARSSESHELDAHECWKYIGTTSLGRLAVVVDGRPEIFPVNYVPDEGSVVFRTGQGTKLGATTAGQPLALEIDGMNRYGTIAWSVVLKGLPEEIRDARDLPVEIPAPWEGGEKEHVIRIVPTQLSGRRFVIADPEHWWPPVERGSGTS